MAHADEGRELLLEPLNLTAEDVTAALDHLDDRNLDTRAQRQDPRARIALRYRLVGHGPPVGFADHLDILRKPSAEEIQRLFQTWANSNPRLPTGDALKSCVVRPVVADIDRFSLRRKLLHNEV